MSHHRSSSSSRYQPYQHRSGGSAGSGSSSSGSGDRDSSSSSSSSCPNDCEERLEALARDVELHLRCASETNRDVHRNTVPHPPTRRYPHELCEVMRNDLREWYLYLEVHKIHELYDQFYGVLWRRRLLRDADPTNNPTYPTPYAADHDATVSRCRWCVRNETPLQVDIERYPRVARAIERYRSVLL